MSEIVEIVEQDLPTAVNLLQTIQSDANSVTEYFGKLLKQIKDDFSANKGISFLELKYHLLLSYLINLTYVLLLKTSGQSIQDDLAILRLVEIRTVLEKMRPIDQKLRYQIDKLIKAASTCTESTTDPLKYKANPDNLVSKLDDEEGESENDDNKNKQKLYVPPRLVPVHYDGDETIQDQEQKLLEKAKKRALSSSILKDLQQEYDTGPEEIHESKRQHNAVEDKNFREKIEYEEANLIRIPLSKKEMAAKEKQAAILSLNELTRFGDLSALNPDEIVNIEKPVNKKRKLSARNKQKGKKRKGKKSRNR